MMPVAPASVERVVPLVGHERCGVKTVSPQTASPPKMMIDSLR